MIRYVCPHCERVCESADVMRGFSVICLGCRQPVRVPAESTVADDTPAPPPPPRPRPPVAPSPPPPPPVAVEPPVVIPPKPVVIPPPRAEVRRPVAPRPPGDPAARRRLVRLGVLGALVIVVLAAAGFGYRWYGKRKVRKEEAAQRAELDRRKDTVRGNFMARDLKKLGGKVPKWEIAPVELKKLKGKVIILSVTDEPNKPRSFWSNLAGRWPLQADDGALLIKDLFERGQVDDRTFDFSDYLWAEGPSDVGMIIGLRFRKEVGGLFIDGNLVEIEPGIVAAEYAGSDPVALRFNVTAIVLDPTAGRLVARRTFPGPLPPSKPAAGKNEVSGLLPAADITNWLRQLETGRAEP